MRKILFLDRDGTIIKEPEDEQIDSLEKLEFVPGVFSALKVLVNQFDYKLIMVTNQDGLGTEKYPQETFDIVQDKLIKTLHGEDIKFEEVLIDRTFPEEKSPNRKPKIGLVKKYLNELLDYEKSFVIGDRLSDLQLAKNMNIKGVLLGNMRLDTNEFKVCSSWKEIVELIRSNYR